jgi:hypothetical protein
MGIIHHYLIILGQLQCIKCSNITGLDFLITVLRNGVIWSTV